MTLPRVFGESPEAFTGNTAISLMRQTLARSTVSTELCKRDSI